MHIFGKLTDVPDLVPEGLLLPRDRPDLHVVSALATEDTTTPKEIGYIILHNEPGDDDTTPTGEILVGVSRVRAALLDHGERQRPAEDFLDTRWIGITWRALLRVALDPSRNRAVNLVSVYEEELWKLGVRRFDKDSKKFFETFASKYGVLRKRGNL